MRNYWIKGLLLASLFLPVQLQAQSSDQENVRKVIQDLFDGMREGDSAKVSNLFHPNVRMMTSYTNQEGEKMLKEGSLQGFLSAVGTPHPEIWNEEIWDTEIRIDDDLAQVWTDYAFYVGEEFSHCGIDAFQLVRGSDGHWRIINLIDTRRKEPCERP